MLWLDFKRIIKSGWISFTRNAFVSASNVLVMTITLSVLASLLFVNAVLHFSIAELEDKVDITVYFKAGTSESLVFSLEEELKALPEIDYISYTSATQALEEFQKLHADEEVLAGIAQLDENPLGPSLAIKAYNPRDYVAISALIEKVPEGAQDPRHGIDRVDFNENRAVIEKLLDITESARNLGFIITAILALITVGVTFNTIRLAIYMAREEISVMRLVGASHRYIRGPFIVEGVLYGFVSSLLTMIALYPATLWLGKNMTGFLGIDLFVYYIVNFFPIFVALSVFGIILGVVSSFIAIRKYLKT